VEGSTYSLGNANEANASLDEIIRSDRRNVSRAIKGNERKGKETMLENFTPVSGLIGGLPDKRRKFLKAVYDLAQGRPTAHVNKADVALRLDMDVGDREGFEEFMAIGQYLDDLGCIRTFQSGAEGYREYGELGITGQGIDKVEEVEESAR
jgi:hypothetical protein